MFEYITNSYTYTEDSLRIVFSNAVNALLSNKTHPTRLSCLKSKMLPRLITSDERSVFNLLLNELHIMLINI